MNTDCTSTGYREPTPFYVCFIPLPPPYSSSIKRASTHATVAPPPISDHPLAFRDRFNHPRGPLLWTERVLRDDLKPRGLDSIVIGGGTWNRNFGGIDHERRYWLRNFVYCIRCECKYGGVRWTLNFDTRDEIVNLISERNLF